MSWSYSVLPKTTVSMCTRDGVRLDADVYRPDAAGPWPVLLMRQPYGREIASTVVYAHPRWYAAQGFMVVIQDVRGRGTSAGAFRLFETEVQDGFDTVNWAATLPHSNGNVGMYGFSYQGMTQLFAAESAPSALKAIAPAMVGYHPHEDWAYENGALLLQAGLGWAIQLAAESARLRGDREAFQALYQASRQLPLNDEIAACPEVLTRYAPDSFFHDWLEHPQADDYWTRITPQLDSMDLPMLHVGGWFDPYLRGDVRLYQEMVARSQYPQPLWIGPWGHIPWGRIVGIRDFGAVANSPIDRLQVDWFSHWLQAVPPSWPDGPTVHLFEIGGDRWRSFSHWPHPEKQRWQLTSNGLATMDSTAGSLTPATPANAQIKSRVPCEDVLVHDPWRPVPSIGGHAGFPSGVFNRAAVDCRSDVLTYTSEPLSADLHVAGHIEVTLLCQCDRPTFDLSVVCSEVLPDHTVYSLTQGYARFESVASDWQTCRLPLQPTCFRVAAGCAIRLSIAAACYPAYAMNPGTGATAKESSVMTAKIITVRIHSDAPETGLWLPVVAA